MKKFLIIILLVNSIIAFGQVEKGDIVAQGNLSFFAAKGATVGLFFLKGGYFVSKNIEVGSTLQVIFSTETGVGIGPYGTYNFLTDNAKLLPYAGAQFSVFSFAGTNVNSFGLYGGSKYFITEAVNLDGGLSFMQGFGESSGLIFTATLGVGVVLGKIH